MARADRALLAKRVNDILRIRLDGAEWWDVVDFVREKETDPTSNWFVAEGDKPLSEGMIRKYQEKSDDEIHKANSTNRKRLFRQHLGKRRNLYSKATTSGDLRTALSVLQDEAHMLDLYPATKTRSDVNVNAKVSVVPSEMSNDELSQYIRESRGKAVLLGLLGSPDGDGATVEGDGKPARLHEVHEAGIRDELASPPDLPTP